MKKGLLYMLLSAGAALNLYPFLWMLGTSLKSLPEATRNPLDLLPDAWLWSNYTAAFQAAPFTRYLLNSLVIAGATAAGVTFTSIMAGYAFARLDFKGKPVLFGLLLATMLIPFEITLIPNFVLITRFGWYNTYAALIFPWCANAFSIFLVRQAFLAFPRDYFDAALADGCGHLQFLARVGVPLVRPMIITVALFAFLGSYNALLWPLVVTSDETHRVAQVGLTTFVTDAGVRVNLLMCASAIVIAPTMAIYLVAQRYLETTALGAGLKG